MNNIRKVFCIWIVVTSLVGFPLTAASAKSAQAIPHFQVSQGSDNHVQKVLDASVPKGLNGTEWANIQAQIVSSSYKIQPADSEGNYLAANSAYGWHIAFTRQGVQVTPRDANDWSWGLTLAGYGYTDLARLGNSPSVGMSTAAAALTYHWNDNISEWWINGPNGLEQGFTLQQRPAGYIQGQPLQLDMVMTGNLIPNQTGESIRFQNADGATMLTYDKLHVTDATGRVLPARIQLQPLVSTLRILVADDNATYPLTIDPLVQQAYLKASNTEANDLFGRAVAVSGDTVVVGAYGEDSNATGVNGNQADNSAESSGAAYVFVRSGGTWSQQAYLKASNTEAGDWFGYSVAISGDTIVVGAEQEDSNAIGVNGNQSDNSRIGSGAAYVFVRSGGIWSQQAYLKASNNYNFVLDGFGHSVAISNDTIVVGPSQENSNATGVNGNQNDYSALGAGAAYVFVRNGTIWSQEAYLKASNTDAWDYFGRAVAVSGDTIVVGAFSEDSNATGVDGDQSDNSAGEAGAAYVFVRSGTTWSQQAYLKASNTDAVDDFGYAVAISGDTIVVGAYLELSNATGVNGDQSDNSGGHRGAVYVFVRSGATWSQEAYLKASYNDSGGDDYFGYAVTISGDTVVIGAYGEDSNATGVNGDQTNNSAINAGAAYVFARSGATWSQQAYLKASNTGGSDWFGYAVAISGDTVMIGAYYEDGNAIGVNSDQSDNSAINSGGVYVFVPCVSSVQTGSWGDTATWNSGSVPASTDTVCVLNGNTVSLGANAAVAGLQVYPNGTLDLGSNSFTAESIVTNDGLLRQMQSVDSSSVEFLHIQNIAATNTAYRGVLVNSSLNSQNLGSTTVSVRELNPGEYCTTHGGASPTYARRCYEITPGTPPVANVRLRLYARTADELNGIAEGNLAVYRYQGTPWTELTTNRTTSNDGGNYSYAEGDTSGFSSFLLGTTGNAPTAVQLNRFSAQNGASDIAIAAVGGLALIIGSAALTLRRRVWSKRSEKNL